jgi:ABC-2 type transport system ATP-binding protein
VARFGDLRPPREGTDLSLAVEDGTAQIAPVVRALDDAGLCIAHLQLIEPTLDDVFVEKTGRHLEGADAPGAAAAPEPEAAAPA